MGKDTGQVQAELFAAADGGAGAEPVLMALNAEFYELIWRGQKRHEFRRRFLEGRPVRWFVYLNAPVSLLAAVIDLGPAIVDVPERIAAVAEAGRPGTARACWSMSETWTGHSRSRSSVSRSIRVCRLRICRQS